MKFWNNPIGEFIRYWLQKVCKKWVVSGLKIIEPEFVFPIQLDVSLVETALISSETSWISDKTASKLILVSINYGLILKMITTIHGNSLNWMSFVETKSSQAPNTTSSSNRWRTLIGSFINSLTRGLYKVTASLLITFLSDFGGR